MKDRKNLYRRSHVLPFIICLLFSTFTSTCTCFSAFAQETGAYTTAAPAKELPAEVKPVPYTEFASFKPIFTEEPLDGDEIDLSREDVENVYREFRTTIVNPPYPPALAGPSDYKIDNAQEAFDRCAFLCKNINKLIFSAKDGSLEKYGSFLQAMRDVVYLDAVCLKEYNEGKTTHRDLWHSMHNKWLSAVGERYAALPAAPPS